MENVSQKRHSPWYDISISRLWLNTERDNAKSVSFKSTNDSDRPVLISDSIDASKRIIYNLHRCTRGVFFFFWKVETNTISIIRLNLISNGKFEKHFDNKSVFGLYYGRIQKGKQNYVSETKNTKKTVIAEQNKMSGMQYILEDGTIMRLKF